MKGKIRIGIYFIPVFVALIMAAAGQMAPFLRTPTFSEIHPERNGTSPESLSTATFEIAGISCYGTSKTLAKWVFALPGILGVTTYSSNREVKIRYDSSKISADEIVMAIEKDVELGGKKSRPFEISRYRETDTSAWVDLRKKNITEVDEL